MTTTMTAQTLTQTPTPYSGFRSRREGRSQFAEIIWYFAWAILDASSTYPARMTGHLLPAESPDVESLAFRKPPGVVGIISPWNPGHSAPTEAMPPFDYEALFVANLSLIEGVIDFVCRRHRLPVGEAEEFGADVKLRLVDHDYEILRRFQQRSSLKTYLTVVIQRLFLDYRNRLWGKWRPSAEARRLGAVAVRLEMLLVRDGLSFDQACETLRTNEAVNLDRFALEEIVIRLPIRVRRVRVGEEVLEGLSQHDEGPDTQASVAAHQLSALAIRHAVAQAVESLPPQDRLILRLRFHEDLAVADIARALHLEQKPLYRRLDNLLRSLRSALERAGIDRDEARDALAAHQLDVMVALSGQQPDAAWSPLVNLPVPD